MLGRLLLIVLQISIGWFGAPMLLRYLPGGLGGDLTTFIHACLFGLIAYVVGLVGSQALKDVAMPSPSTLIWSVAGGAIGGALVILKVPAMVTAATKVGIVPMSVPLILAIIGYAMKR